MSLDHIYFFQLNVNIMFKRERDKLNKEVPFSSHLADLVLWAWKFLLDLHVT